MEKLAQILIERGIFLKKIIEEKRTTLKVISDESLRIRVHRGRAEYYKVDKNGKEMYVGRIADEKVKLLAQIAYDRKVLIAVEKELSTLNDIFKKYFIMDDEGKKYKPALLSAEEVYKKLPDERQKLVIPIVLTDEQFIQEWESVEYTGKPFDEDAPEFYTDKGERVRSKSEVLIANMLKRKGIPYKYECPLELRQMGRVYPDFTILDVRRRKEWYWEHLGMMENADYCMKNLAKITAYERTGLLPGRDVIITHETSSHPLNLKIIEAVLDSYLK